MQIRKPWLGLLGALALTASCSTTSSDDAGSGGAPASGGTTASGGVPASGGSPATGGLATGGSSADLGGSAGSAGAPAPPGCGCSEESSITIELPEGPHVYDRIAEQIDHCNLLTCEPDSAYAIHSGAPPDRYLMRACDAEGECVSVKSGALGIGSTEGSVWIESDGDVILDEPATVVADRVLDVSEPTLEFTFEADTVEGSGSLCWANTTYICLK